MGRHIILSPVLVALIIFTPCTVLARVSGVCSNCHTMHNSQNGQPVDPDHTNGYLLNTGSDPCVACHSSGTSSTYYDLGDCKVPVVLYTGGSAPTSYLAGGNFWWVSPTGGANDTKGHNVFLGHDDDYLTAAPGSLITCGTDACHANLSEPADVGMAELNGKYGCEGCHLDVKHHADDHTNGGSGLVDTAAKGWYRFLSGHMSGSNHGVEGYEDGVWEAGLHDGSPHQGTTQHNEYLGNVVSGGSGFSANGNTMTGFCTGCHGEFHDNQQSGGGWIRHPSDAIIPNEREYQYAGGTTHLYDPLSPVARPSLSDPPTNPDKVTPGTDMVMCLSCHRPHGSPYPDLLRWDYTQQIANSDPAEGTLDQGCFYCHTEKDN